MRYLVLSDLHANLEATDAVLAAGAALAPDHTLVLGDLVGYGPDPAAVLDRILPRPATTIIRGNHDRVAAGLGSDRDFNPHARAAIRWTAAQLTPDRLQALAALPRGPRAVDADVEICHGAPFDEDFYVHTPADAEHAGRAAGRRICLFGHTHVAAAFGWPDGRVRLLGPSGQAPCTLDLAQAGRWLINPGAVGQPRDGDWRAAFAIVDTTARTCTLHRAEYDAAETRRKMRAAGLPAILISRIGR
ncbi:MAG: metallophosphoesterase [Vicinamibacterales bacterium]